MACRFHYVFHYVDVVLSLAVVLVLWGPPSKCCQVHPHARIRAHWAFRHEQKGEPRMINVVCNIVKLYKRPGLSTRGWTL